MATARRRQTARKNGRTTRRPEGRTRAKPGTRGRGAFFRVVIRDKDQFTTFRTQDVGEPGHVERLAGRRRSGSWATQAWLIAKTDAHRDGDRLVADTRDAKQVLDELRGPVTHVKGDVFSARPRRNVAERDKATAAQRQRPRSSRP